MRLGSLCAVIAPLLFAFSGLAQTTIHVPADQPTIQAGINAAVNGDNVLVAPGTYFENIDFKGKAITVTSSGSAASTIIDGGGIASAVTFATHEPRTAVLSNFTITHGGLNNSGQQLYAGSGISITNSAPTILNNIITQNYCQNISVSDDGALIQGNIVSSSLNAAKCFVLNTGGIYISNSTNTTPGATPHTFIVGNTIENNTTGQTGDGGGDGGPGIAIWGGSPVIQNNIIRNNVTLSGSGGGINIVYGAAVSIIQNLIYANTAGCGGGGIGSQMGSLSANTYLLIANNTIVGNNGSGNGGYTDCRKTSEVWTAFYEGGGPSIKFVNNIFDANATPALDCGSLQGGSFNPINQAHQSLFDHNLLYDSAGSFFATNCFDTSHLNGNLVADPQFVNPAANDYHLKATSPAIDTGNGSVLQNLKILSGVSLTQDFDGNPRELDATNKGYPIIDMGAYEFAGVSDATPTRVVLTPSVYYGPDGPVTLTATLSSALGTPTGPVTFFSDGAQLGVANAVNGVATLSNQPFSPGVHVLLATYPGQASYPASLSVVVIIDLDKYTPTLSLTSNPNPSLLNSPVTFTITATSTDNAVLAPITLTNQTINTTLATLTPNSSGVATFTTSALPLGNNDIIAFYPGDSAHSSASATLFQNVTNGYVTTTSLTSSLNPSTYGQPVTFTAQVTSTTGTPTGSVQFFDGTIPLSGALPLNAAGVATYTTSTLLVGSQSLDAVYTPTGSYAASTGYLAQVVNGLPTVTTVSLTPNPSTYGQPQIFSVHVVPVTPNTLVLTGMVDIINFCHGAQIPLTLDANGNATVTVPYNGGISNPVGTCSFSATYLGDTHFAPSTSATLNEVVTPAPSTTTIAASPNPGYALAPITVNVTVVGNPSPTISSTGQIIPPGTTVPSGTLTLTDGATTLGTASVLNGKATFTLTTLALGSHTLTVTYAADPNLAGSSAHTLVTVLANTTTTTLTASPNPAIQGQTITLAATVADTTSSAVPTGTVQFFNGAMALGSMPVSATGAATLSIAFPPGLQSLTAVYTPSSNAFMPSSAVAVALQVAAQDFSFTTTEPSITIQTQHHASLPLTLTSIGGFSGPISIACTGTLPAWLTCELPNSTQLAANATITSTFTLDTDQVINFLSRSQPPATPGSRLPIALATLLPLTLLGLRKRRTLRRATLALLTLALAATTLTACSGYYPYSTAPGTYTIPLTATGISNGITTTITHTLNITLTVTP